MKDIIGHIYTTWTDLKEDLSRYRLRLKDVYVIRLTQNQGPTLFKVLKLRKKSNGQQGTK